MSRLNRSLSAFLFSLGAILAPLPAWAHTAYQSLGSFWSGVAHLLTSLDQIAVFLGLAVWVSCHDRNSDAPVIAAAFSAVVVGVGLGATIGSQLDCASLSAILMVLVGLAGAGQFRVGNRPLIGVATAGGLFAGGASGQGPAAVSLGLFSLGGAVATASVISWGLIAARGINVAWGRIALRALASWIAAIGLMILALAGSRYFGHR
ncbi:MAG: HupE/UreJ family protein [Stellaceae bacterium]|jgi:urease accessory protein